MSTWKDEDVATIPLIKEYLKEFREGIENNPDCKLDEEENARVQESLDATEQFCTGLLTKRKSKLYMHDLIMMTMGFYGGYLTALDDVDSSYGDPCEDENCDCHGHEEKAS
jgi:hypothetical protein